MKFIRLASLFGLLLVSAMAPLRADATTQIGTIIRIFVNGAGTVFVTVDDPTIIVTACTRNRYAFKFKDSQEGKAMYALVLAAFALNKTVEVTGQDTCNVHPDSETIRFVRMDS